MPKEDERQKAREDASAAAHDRSKDSVTNKRSEAMKTRSGGARPEGKQREADAQKIRDGEAPRRKPAGKASRMRRGATSNYPDDAGKA